MHVSGVRPRAFRGMRMRAEYLIAFALAGFVLGFVLGDRNREEQ